MSLNKYMHPRSPFYMQKPDFALLAKTYPEFQKHYKSSHAAKVDYTDPDALKSLYCVLMKHYFNLDVDVPSNHLIPRVPQRTNYVLWIEDLLQRPEKATGIDIGSGASCVFSLICSTLNPGWRMIASDISSENVEFSRRNISRNNLDQRISKYQVHKVDKDTLLVSLLEQVNRESGDSESIIDFVMCNPPFYSNEQDLEGRSEQIRKPEKRPKAKSVNTARTHESIYDEGGEVGFIKTMIDESIILATRVRVYTTMLGKKSSLIALRNYLVKDKGVVNVSETEFCQGNTMRWGLAWSYLDEPLPKISFFKSIVKECSQNDSLVSVEYSIPVDKFNQNEYNLQYLFKYIKDIMSNELQFMILDELPEDGRIKLKAEEKSWANQRAKRRREKLNHQTQEIVSQRIDFELTVSIFQIDDKLNLKLSHHQTTNSDCKEWLNQILQYVKNKIVRNN